MKHVSLALCALLLIAPAGALLSGCGGGGGLVSGTLNQDSANLTITRSSDANMSGSSTFSTITVKVFSPGITTASASNGFGIQCTDASQRDISFYARAIASGSFSAGQSFDLTDNQVVLSSNTGGGGTWDSLSAQMGSITVKSVSGPRVTFQLSNFVLSPQSARGNPATGTLTLNGTITATFPVTAATPTAAALKRKSS